MASRQGMLGRVRVPLAVLLAPVALAACVPPGDNGSLGTFQVTAVLTSNTCGAQAVPFQSAVAFNAEIRVAQGLMHWIPENGSDTVGTYDTGTGSFRLELDEAEQVIAPDVHHQIVGCTLDRADVIQGIMGLAVPDGGTVTDSGSTTGTDAGTSTGIDTGVNPTDAGVTVDAAIPPVARTSFTGTQTIVYGAEPSGDCTSIVGAASGDFSALPCTVTYTISGVAR